jgi:hypothetical protein
MEVRRYPAPICQCDHMGNTSGNVLVGFSHYALTALVLETVERIRDPRVLWTQEILGDALYGFYGNDADLQSQYAAPVHEAHRGD